MESKSFLYIEDHPASQKVMALLLREVPGFKNLIMFSDSQNIISRLEATQTEFDVIFLDLHIKPEDGFAIHQKLRQHKQFSQAKIVALTATVVPHERKAIREVGFDGLITKPLNYHTFPQFVQQILAGEAIWENM